VLGGVPLAEVVDRVGTPAYVYDLDAMAAEARALREGFGSTPHLVAYAMKANSAGAILRALAAEGCGAEVVSGAELAVALGVGIAADQILYSGVGKQASELDRAIGAGDRGIRAIQMESVEEIPRVDAIAQSAGRRARVSLRVNPGVEADTHAHVATGHDEAKFGVAREDLPAALDLVARSPNVELVGLSSHVGSQLTRTDEYVAAATVLLEIAAPLADRLEFVDFGGGFGIDYGAGCPASPGDFARAAVALLASSKLAGKMLVTEPGRSLVAAHGVLCASVITTKDPASGARRWVVIDAGMNDLIRPALYGARHRIEDLDAPAAASADARGWRVVGPVCESSDDFGEHPFASAPSRVVIRDAGAYGYTMAGEYNGRVMPAEVFLRGGRIEAVSRPREVEAWIAERIRAGQAPAATSR
jgi:diaminopimelate decarboxylase